MAYSAQKEKEDASLNGEAGKSECRFYTFYSFINSLYFVFYIKLLWICSSPCRGGGGSIRRRHSLTCSISVSVVPLSILQATHYLHVC